MSITDHLLLSVVMAVAMIYALSWLTVGRVLQMAPRASNGFFAANVCIAASAFVMTEVPAHPLLDYLSDWLMLVGFIAYRMGLQSLTRAKRIPRLKLAFPLPCAITLGVLLEWTGYGRKLELVVFSAACVWILSLCFVDIFLWLKEQGFSRAARLGVSWPFLAGALGAFGRLVEFGLSYSHAQALENVTESTFTAALWMLLVLNTVTNISLGSVTAAKLVSRIRLLADHDPLTGCLNRRTLINRLSVEINRNQRGGNQLAVVLFDLDNFKIINDTYGHDVGDKALKHVVGQTMQLMRSTDVLVRYGGEEFLLLLPDTAMSGARDAATRLRLQLEGNPLQTDGKSIPVLGSFGIAVFATGESMESFLSRADGAMYQAKSRGRNRVEVAG